MSASDVNTPVGCVVNFMFVRNHRNCARIYCTPSFVSIKLTTLHSEHKATQKGNACLTICCSAHVQRSPTQPVDKSDICKTPIRAVTRGGRPPGVRAPRSLAGRSRSRLNAAAGQARSTHRCFDMTGLLFEREVRLSVNLAITSSPRPIYSAIHLIISS